MATTSFKIYGGARLSLPSIQENRTATFRITGGALMRFDPFGSSGFSRSAATSARGWLPPENMRWVNDDGTPTPQFARAMHELFNIRMGGISGPSMAEVQSNVVETKAQASQAFQAVSAVNDAVVANAEALVAVKEVAQTAALPGATQIPDVIVRTAYKRNLDLDTFN